MPVAFISIAISASTGTVSRLGAWRAMALQSTRPISAGLSGGHSPPPSGSAISQCSLRNVSCGIASSQTTTLNRINAAAMVAGNASFHPLSFWNAAMATINPAAAAIRPGMVGSLSSASGAAAKCEPAMASMPPVRTSQPEPARNPPMTG